MKKLIVLAIIGIVLFAACEPATLEATDDPTRTLENAEVEETLPQTTEPTKRKTTATVLSATTATPETTPSGEMATPSLSKMVEITIKNNRFENQAWVVHEDTVIKWTNQDDVTHTVVVIKTSDSYDDLEDSDDDYDDHYKDEQGEYKNTFEFTLSPGQSFIYTFDDDGRYEFYLTGEEGSVGIIHVSDDYGDDDYDDDYDDDDYDDDDHDDDHYDDDDYDDDDYDDDDYDDDDDD